MIRDVQPKDSKGIATIYNEYVLHSTATFEEKPVSEQTIQERLAEISTNFPFLVFEENSEIVAYAYAHKWKEKDAYKYTLETTVYVAPKYQKKGIGLKLMQMLIDECKTKNYKALIACITKDNKGSIALHKKLGFFQVSDFKSVGLKFGKLLDVCDYELLL